jgi:two-component system, OmpR family, sensor histidine kinase VicK
MYSAQKEPDIHFFQICGDQANHVFFVFDFAIQQFSYLNAAFEQVWKRNADSIYHHPASLLPTIHTEDRQHVQERYQQFLAHPVQTNLEFRIIAPDGTDRWIRLQIYPIEQENKLRFAAGIAEDDSLRKKNFFHMQQINAKKNATLEILSHDLRAPLATIQGLSHLIQKRVTDATPEVTEWLGIIGLTCQRSLDLIRDFVSQEFLESEDMEVSKERLDLVWEIKQVLEMYKSEEKNLAKKFTFTYSHPQIYAEVDSMKFTLVINNLISNAIKFTYDHGIISIHMEQKEPSDTAPGKVLISVWDNGIGIPKDIQPYLFDKFTKARRPGLKGEESVGLGMSIIKTIVEWHQGNIWFISEENKGTTFFIEIPQQS